jgi:hypothetical protein
MTKYGDAESEARALFDDIAARLGADVARKLFAAIAATKDNAPGRRGRPANENASEGLLAWKAIAADMSDAEFAEFAFSYFQDRDEESGAKRPRFQSAPSIAKRIKRARTKAART